MNALEYIQEKFSLDLSARTPIEFRLSRHGGLTTLWRELGYKVGAEIGTEQGKFSEEICCANPEVKLYCVDPWQAYDRYADHVSQSKLDGFYAEAVERMKRYNCEIIRKASTEAVGDFAECSLDFVFIDGNHHFDFVVRDIIEWSRKVRQGGMVSGHDYRQEGKEKKPIPFHVIQATNAYTDAYKIRPWFVMRGDKCASWMWIKP